MVYFLLSEVQHLRDVKIFRPGYTKRVLTSYKLNSLKKSGSRMSFVYLMLKNRVYPLHQ